MMTRYGSSEAVVALRKMTIDIVQPQPISLKQQPSALGALVLYVCREPAADDQFSECVRDLAVGV
jgi:hypothetical protein